jgi:hypothetical protein
VTVRDGAGGDCSNTQVFPPHHRVDQDPGDRFTRDDGRIAATTLGVKVAGIGFDTQSGFSKNVQFEYRFSSRKLPYFICGIGGTVDKGNEPMPSSWTQLWAGA